LAVRQKVPEVERIGERLRKLRKLRGMTQSELARQIGIQQSDLSRMEKGTYRVSLDNLFKILGVFGMDVAQFFQQETAPAADPAPAPLSHEDMQTLHMLRRLDPEARREVQEFLEFKLRRQRAEERQRDNEDRSRWGQR